MPEHTRTCPFCALLCDDLRVSPGARPRPRTRCPIARAGYGRARLNLQPLVDGKPVSLETACRQAARLLARARRPLYGGLATDVAGMRAAVRLAERTGGILDHAHSAAMQAQLRLLRERGWIATTLGELRHRADLLVLFGSDAISAHPRFFERLRTRAAVNRAQPLPELVSIGRGLSLPAGYATRHIDAPQGSLGEIAHALTLRIAGHTPPRTRRTGGVAAPELDRLARKLTRARYAVLAWEPARLPGAQADLQVHAFCDLVEALNRTTRAAGLALGGAHGSHTAQAVCTWLSGHPARVGFPGGVPRADSIRFDWRRVMANGETDALVWISAFDGDLLPEPTLLRAGGPPFILLARADRPPPATAHVYIPIGTPGIEHPGHLCRLDGVVAHYARGGLRRGVRHPAAATVLSAIHARLAEARP